MNELLMDQNANCASYEPVGWPVCPRVLSSAVDFSTRKSGRVGGVFVVVLSVLSVLVSNVVIAQPRVRYTAPPQPVLTDRTAPAREVTLDDYGLKQFGELPGEFDDSDHDGVPDIDDKCADTPHQFAHRQEADRPLVDECGCSLTGPLLLEEDEALRRLATLISEDTVNFAFDESVLSANAIRLLDDYVARVQGKPLDVLIEGHADSVGSRLYNQKLSERRARAVQQWLRRRGVSTEIVRSRGFGETRPKVDSKTDAARMQNRRVEMTIRYEKELVGEQQPLPLFSEVERFLEIDCPEGALELEANGQRMLNKLAAYLLLNQSRQLRIFGQTGERYLSKGDRNRIARARASYTRKYLVELGVPAGRLLPLWGDEVAAGRCVSMSLIPLPESAELSQ